MKNLLVATLGLALAVTSAAAEDKQVIRKLKNCGSEATNAFGKHKEYPATNEGAGYVGFQTEETNAEGTTERYNLVNCDARKLVRAEAVYLLKNSGKDVNLRNDLFAFVDGLRDSNRLANEGLFTKAATAAGYKMTAGKLPPAYSEKAARADCGCRLYYPELMP